MENFVKENWFKLAIILGVLLISFSVAYYIFYFLPHKEQLILNQKQQEKLIESQRTESQRNLLNNCLEDAKSKISTFIKNSCTPDGANYDCVDGVVEPYKKQVNDECFRLYPPAS